MLLLGVFAEVALLHTSATDPAIFGSIALLFVLVALIASIYRRGALRGSIRWRRCEPGRSPKTLEPYLE